MNKSSRAFELAKQFLDGKLDEQQFLRGIAKTTVASLSDASVDLDRARRVGYPEVVFAEGKTTSSVVEIVQRLKAAGQPVLATRVSDEQAAVTLQACPDFIYHETARTIRSPAEGKKVGRVAVVSAGTSDLPVATEATETLHWMNVNVVLVQDVGVAGPHRLPAHLDQLQHTDAVVVVAGMEGALPSVVAGYLSCPIVAVPTSVGYGANLGGIAALLGMLNSCAANVAVVNIDAGFKGGYLAGMIAQRTHAESANQE